jgi:integrase/recombinase XerD
MAINRNASVAIILEKRFPHKDGTFPVKLRVTHNRKQKYYSIGTSLSEEDYQKLFTEKPRKPIRELRDKILGEEKKALSIIEKLPDFDFQKFEKQILILKDDTNNIFHYYTEYIKLLTRDGRAGNSSSYECSQNSLKAFIKKDKFPFNEVTVDFLKSYEKWMLKESISPTGELLKGKSLTTVGIYLRSLRTLYNLAVRDGIVKAEFYPFGKGKYQIPAGRNVKKALTLSDIEKIFNYPTIPGTGEARAKDLWIMSYLCNGINIKDIARLKYKNIDGETIVFNRAKTEFTSRKNPKSIVAILTPIVGRIIDTWGTKSNDPDDYVFSILEKSITPKQELARIKQATKTINKYVKRVAKAAGIEKNVTTYTARHSYATVLKRAGVSTEFISESLGHSDLKTTESYLASFEDSVKKQHAAALTDFPK